MGCIRLFLLIAPLGLTGCVETAGVGVDAGPQTVGRVCVNRAARALKVDRTTIAVTQTLSYPEGEVVTMTVPGQGKLRCSADVDGKLGDLVWIEGGPADKAST